MVHARRLAVDLPGLDFMRGPGSPVSHERRSTMTEWHDWPAWRQVAAAAHDRVSSAALVGADAAEAVEHLTRQIADLAPEAFPAAVFDAVDMLGAGQQAMAPIANLRNAVYLAAPHGPEAVIHAVAELGERIAKSSRLIGKVGTDLIPDRGTVMIHSASSTVRLVLEWAREHKSFDVVCTKAMPIGEGIEMASDLLAGGFDVELIDDDVAFEVLPGADLVLAGADAVGPEQAINKVGTAALAGAAGAEGVPFYLMVSTDKILPKPLFLEATHRRGREDLSEVIELSVFRGIVTEQGLLSPSEVAVIAGRLEVAEALITD
jgi:translation initiation factor 2B subunit (eIF-2B alpha/beta/delta family)